MSSIHKKALLVTLLTSFFTAGLLAQPSNRYLFVYKGYCCSQAFPTYGVDIMNETNTSRITHLDLACEYKSKLVTYPAQDRVYMDFESVGNCIIQDQSTSLDHSRLDLSMGVTGAHILMYWSPVISNVKIWKIKGSTSTSLPVRTMNQPLTETPVELEQNNRITIDFECPYTGNDFVWKIIRISDGHEVTIGSTRTLSIDGQFILDNIGANKKFYIQIHTPDWIAGSNPDNTTKTYQTAYQRSNVLVLPLQELEVTPSCSNNMEVTITSSKVSDPNVFVDFAFVGSSGPPNLIPGRTNLRINALVEDYLIEPHMITGSGIDTTNVFALHVFKSGTETPYTNSWSGLGYYAPPTAFEVICDEDFCPEENTSFTIKRDHNKFLERYQLLYRDVDIGVDFPDTDSPYYDMQAGPTGETEHAFNGLDPGNYRIIQVRTMEGALECTHENVEYFDINVLPQPDPPDVEFESAWCNKSNASIRLESDFTSENANYQLYNWSDGLINSTTTNLGYATMSNLNFNTNGYFVRLTDPNGCISNSSQVNFIDYDPIDFSNLNSIQPLCYGGDATLVFSDITGGPEGTTYEFSYGSGYNTNLTYPGLSGSIPYTLTVRDRFNQSCSSTKSFRIGEPSQIILSTDSIIVEDAICFGQYGGLTVFGFGGTGELKSIVSNPEAEFIDSASVKSRIDAPTGSYDIWLRDVNGCESNVHQHTEPIGTNSKIVFNEVTTKVPTCVDRSDGEIHANNISGGGGGYSYYWDNDSEGSDITGLTSGTYKITVQDIYGCTRDTSINLVPPESIDAELTGLPTLCPGQENGSIQINSISNGSGGYQYAYSESGPFMDIPGNNLLTGLAAGSGIIHIADNTMCMAHFPYTIPEKIHVESLSAPSKVPPSCATFADGSIVLNGLTLSDDSEGNLSNYSYHWFNEAENQTWDTQNLIDISAGFYDLTVYDTDDCISNTFKDIELDQPDPLEILTPAITDASCAESGDGILTVNASGGTGDYRYSITGHSQQSSPTFTDVASGVYAITVLDENDCELTQSNFEVDAGLVTLNLENATMISCFGADDGEISLEAAGGGASYTYHYDGPDGPVDHSMATRRDLEKGTYTIIAEDDDTECQSASLDVEITEPEELLLTNVLIDSSACDLAIGSITYDIIGGTGTTTIRWENEIGNTIPEGDMDELIAGTYSVELEDDNNCLFEENYVVYDRPAPVINNHTVHEIPWCNRPMGEVELFMNGGSAPFTYSYADHPELNSSGLNLVNIYADDYELSVTDFYGCTDSYSFSLEDGPPLQPSVTTTDANCNMNNGSASLAVTGGNSPYLYIWPDSVSSAPLSDPDMQNLYAGEYLVYVVDDIGCTDSIYVAVSNLSGPEVYTDNITSSWCGLPTGTASVNFTNGDAPFVYEWFPYGNSSEILSNHLQLNNVRAGRYVFRITDSIGCIDMKQIVISDSAELEPQLEFVRMDSASCGNPMGSLEVSMSGGLSPYSYEWNHSDTARNSMATSLLAGEYTVTAMDSRGCIETLDLEVIDKVAPRIRILASEDAYCGQATGSFLLTINRGEAPYQAYLTNNSSERINFEYADSINQYVAIVNGLLPGENAYALQGIDSEGCTSNIVSNYIDDNNPLQISLVNLEPVNCYGGNDGIAEVLVEQGIEPYTYAWSQNSVNNSLNTGLAPGDFSVTVTDADNCTIESQTWRVLQPAQISLNNLLTDDPSCNGMCDGSAIAYATGGAGGFTFIWNQNDTTQQIEGLCAGNHSLMILDRNNCEIEQTVQINEPPILSNTNLADEQTVCEGQNIILDPGEEYINPQWTSNIGYMSIERSISVSEEGTYFFNGFNADGCEVLDTFRLILSDNLLDAEFLMASEGYVGDTIVLIEVTWPYADICSWNIPEEATVLADEEWYKELVFNTAGSFYVELNAQLATCAAMQGKYIEIFNRTPGKGAEEWIEEKQPLVSKFDVYPNPATENLTMRVELDDAEDIRLEIIDINGSLTNSVFEGFESNEYEVSIEVASLKPGVYMVRLLAGDEVQTKMLVVH